MLTSDKVFGSVDGSTTAAAVDAVLNMDTCRSYTHGTSTHYANVAVSTSIETYSSLTTISDASSPQFSTVLYKACDLDYSQLQIDNLCAVFTD